MQMIRTTITLPEGLYKELKTSAFYKQKTISELIREGVRGVLSKKTVKPGEGIKALNKLGKYSKIKKNYSFNRREFYDEITKRKMSY